jgi:AcrR family transcriptional regulator
LADSSTRTRSKSRGQKRPTRSHLRERYDSKRLEVVDVAARLFAERGYHATSIDDLVEATGLQRGGLYHYIDGKQDLLVAIHERFIDPLLAETRAVEAQNLPADVALRQLCHVLMNGIAEYRDQVTVFLHEWRSIEKGAEWRRIRESRKEFEQTFRSVLSRGLDDGTFVTDDVNLSTLAVLGMINYSYQWYDAKGPRSADELADHFAQILLHGLVGRDRGSSPPARSGAKKRPAGR